MDNNRLEQLKVQQIELFKNVGSWVPPYIEPTKQSQGLDVPGGWRTIESDPTPMNLEWFRL